MYDCLGKRRAEKKERWVDDGTKRCKWWVERDIETDQRGMSSLVSKTRFVCIESVEIRRKVGERMRLKGKSRRQLCRNLTKALAPN